MGDGGIIWGEGVLYPWDISRIQMMGNWSFMHLKLFSQLGNEKYLVLGAILLIYAVIRGTLYFLSRNKAGATLAAGTARDYGILGGAICPKCRRPFALGIGAINLGFGTKFTRCPHFGKWSVARRASLDELRAAESAELADTQAGQGVPEKSEEEKLKKSVDDSRYTDGL